MALKSLFGCFHGALSPYHNVSFFTLCFWKLPVYPLIYCISHPYPSVYEAVVLFLIRWLPRCTIPLYQIETWSMMKGHPIARVRCWLTTCTLMSLLVMEHEVREMPAESCGHLDKDRHPSGLHGFNCGLLTWLCIWGFMYFHTLTWATVFLCVGLILLFI